MAPFFINRPIVAMVISILMVIIGLVAMIQLPIALYPNIAPPEILLTARYPGADAVTLEQSVATPIEQQMSGVDKMLYMYSLNQGSGSQMQLRVDFDVTTDPSVDQVLTNLRYSQAASQLPPDVVNQASASRSPSRARWGSSRSTRRRARTTRCSSPTTRTSTSTTR